MQVPKPHTGGNGETPAGVRDLEASNDGVRERSHYHNGIRVIMVW